MTSHADSDEAALSARQSNARTKRAVPKETIKEDCPSSQTTFLTAQTQTALW